MCFADGDAVFSLNFFLALDEEVCKTFMLRSPFWSNGKESQVFSCSMLLKIHSVFCLVALFPLFIFRILVVWVQCCLELRV